MTCKFLECDLYVRPMWIVINKYEIINPDSQIHNSDSSQALYQELAFRIDLNENFKSNWRQYGQRIFFMHQLFNDSDDILHTQAVDSLNFLISVSWVVLWHNYLLCT